MSLKKIENEDLSDVSFWLGSMDAFSDIEQDALDIHSISSLHKDVAAASFRQQCQAELAKSWLRLKERLPSITYTEIAERLGTDPSLISKRMAGKSNMTLETIAELFLALEASVAIVSHAASELPPAGFCHVLMSTNTSSMRVINVSDAPPELLTQFKPPLGTKVTAKVQMKEFA